MARWHPRAAAESTGGRRNAPNHARSAERAAVDADRRRAARRPRHQDLQCARSHHRPRWHPSRTGRRRPGWAPAASTRDAPSGTGSAACATSESPPVRVRSRWSASPRMPSTTPRAATTNRSSWPSSGRAGEPGPDDAGHQVTDVGDHRDGCLELDDPSVDGDPVGHGLDAWKRAGSPGTGTHTARTGPCAQPRWWPSDGHRSRCRSRWHRSSAGVAPRAPGRSCTAPRHPGRSPSGARWPTRRWRRGGSGGCPARPRGCCRCRRAGCPGARRTRPGTAAMARWVPSPPRPDDRGGTALDGRPDVTFDRRGALGCDHLGGNTVAPRQGIDDRGQHAPGAPGGPDAGRLGVDDDQAGWHQRIMARSRLGSQTVPVASAPEPIPPARSRSRTRPAPRAPPPKRRAAACLPPSTSE